MATLKREHFTNHPHIIGVGLAGILSVSSLGPTPGMIPIILTLSTLLIYSRKIFPNSAPHKGRHAIALWAALTIGGAIPRITASIHALSQPALSLLFLFILSGITSALSIVALAFECRVSGHYSPKYDSIRLLLFPALWPTFWTTIAHLSPVGMLSTWSPIEGLGAYSWLLPILGPEALNWVVAAWAVVVSETLMPLYMGSEYRDDEDTNSLPTTTEPNGNSHHHALVYGNVHSTFKKKDSTALLAALLVLLTVPSYLINSLPIPLGDVSKATPLTLGCALPTVDEYKVPELGFEHYLQETLKMDNTANFILWPEGAVHFRSETERTEQLNELRNKTHHAYIGVSFEETLVDPQNHHGVKRNGIAIVSNRTKTNHLLYYKRHLVPIAESFSLTHSTEPPSTFEAELRFRKSLPIENHKRNVTVTSSICLDFSDPSLFESLEVRPGLILAPARTWDVTVGYTMWKQASQRAHEIGSTLLWCDGGEGGVSGIAAQGINEVFQVGAGSWMRTIGIAFPFDKEDRTLYARYGNTALLLFWALLIGAPVGQRGGQFAQSLFEKVKVNVKKRLGDTSTPPGGHVPVGNLIDNDD